MKTKRNGLFAIIIFLIVLPATLHSQIPYHPTESRKDAESLMNRVAPAKGQSYITDDAVSNISMLPGSVIFSEDFESGQGNWLIQGGVWQIGTPTSGPMAAYRGTKCAGTNLAGNYPNNANATLISPTISLPSVPPGQSLRVRYYSWWRTESDYDYIYLKVSTNSGQSWTTIASSSGNSEGWLSRDFSLSAFAGRTVQIGFQLTSDGSINYPGWYIDEISVELVDFTAIEVVVASNGQFTMGILNGPILLYGHPRPWSSATTVRIDDTDYWNYNRGSWGTIVSAPTWINATVNTGTWAIADGIRVTQTITIVTSLTTRILDTGELRYRVTNTGSTTRRVGLRIMLDTMLGRNDGAPFRVPGVGAVTTDREWLAPSMPPYYQAYDDLVRPTVQSQGTLIGGNAIKPDRLVLTGWERIAATPWDYTITPGRDFTYDSAVGIYWLTVTLAPGESKEFVTYYGLGGIDIDIQPPLVVGLSAATALAFLNGSASGNPFRLSVYLRNSSPGVTQTARGITTTLGLPSGLTLASGETAVRNIPDMVVEAEQSTSYNIQALSSASGSKTYSLTVAATNITSKTVQKSIYLFGITTNPRNNASVDTSTRTVTAQFNVAMNSSTITNATFRITDDAGNALPATVSYNSTDKKATLTLTSNLLPNKRYKARLSSSIQSSDGTNLPHDVEWYFNAIVTTFRWPVIAPRITQDFATYGSVLIGNFHRKFHNGIDMTSAITPTNATEVYAAASGKVIKVKNDCRPGERCGEGFGNFVVIEHAANLYTLYAHLSSVSVTVSDQVIPQGTRIGMMGATGDPSYSPHLHFEVLTYRPSGPSSDPRDLGGGYSDNYPDPTKRRNPRDYFAHLPVRVKTPTLNVRRAPTTNPNNPFDITAFTSITEGQRFVAVGPTYDNWYFIYLPYATVPTPDQNYVDVDRYGWVSGDSLEVLFQMPDTIVTINGQQLWDSGRRTWLPVYSSASASSSELTKVWPGQRFVTFASSASSGGWHRIYLPTNAGRADGWISAASVTSVEKKEQNLSNFVLHQNYPNPFNPSTTIRYALPSRSYVKLEILNLLGQRVAQLVNGELDTGYHQTTWTPGNNLASGVYFYRLEAVALSGERKSLVETKKLLLLR